MANFKVTDSELSGIASAIRLKGGTSDPLVFPSGFVSAISAIETQGTYISKIITSNGEYDPASDNADAFSHVTVSVPTGSSPVLVSKNISANGTYNPVDDNADAYSQVVVNVSGGSGGSDDFLLERRSGTLENNTASIIGSAALQFYNQLFSIICYSVQSIYSSGFRNCSVVEASFPECTNIGQNAFETCNYLEKISFPNCITVDTKAFSACKSLQSVYFPKCEELKTGAFYSCSKLSYVSLPECSQIDGSCFYSCASLSEIHLPKCKTFGSNCFAYCRTISEILLPMCERINNTAFTDCSKLERVVLLNSSVASCGVNIFQYTPMVGSSYLGYFGSIYVPASLVEAYKSASNWSAYSDRITSYVEE